MAFSLLPIKNNIKFLSVMSGSMEPSIKTGSLIIIKPAKNYSVDDVITFKSFDSSEDEKYTTHRIHQVRDIEDKRYFVTKGDANSSPDMSQVEEGRIIGKLILVIPFLGYLIKYIQTLPGLVLIIIIPATIIVYEEAKKIRGEINEMRKKKSKITQKEKKEKNE